MKKSVITVITLVLLAVFGFSGYKIVNYLMESRQQANRAEQLSNLVSDVQASAATEEATEPATEPKATEAAEETKPTEAAAPTEPQMKPEYAALYEQNNDVVGYITFTKQNGQEVKYPVMQTPEDRDFYLYRDFDKKNNAHGWIYAWADADINKPSDNITLFGHHMKDGSMFAGLDAYTSKDVWAKYPLITFDTLYEYHTYKIFAVFKTSANLGEGFSYHKFVDAKNQAEFDEFVKTVKYLSFYDTSITPVYGDKLICLSTCEYTLDNGRLVVCAVRIV